MNAPGRSALAVSVLVLLTGCGGGADPSEPEGTTASAVATPSATPSTAEPAAKAEATPVDGEWTLEQTKSDVVAHLRQHGFEDITGEFLEAEGVWDEDHWTWTFDRGLFKAMWQNPDRSWKVADSGTYTVQPPTLTLTFESGRSTTFEYTLEQDQLLLDWQSDDDAGQGEAKGIPDEVFWRAYLTKPLTRAS